MKRYSVLRLFAAILCFVNRNYESRVEAKTVTCLVSDRKALVELKNGLEDPENRLFSWKGSNCCQWRGIICDNKTGAVISIDLHNPYPINSYSPSPNRYGFWNLSGEISSSLLQIKSLQRLDLSLNTFKDIPIPDFNGSLTNLQYLNLSYAGFIGTIPSNIGNMSSLQWFDLSSDLFSLTVMNLDWFSGLHTLKYLAMNSVDLSAVGSNWVEVLAELTNLSELHLSSCELTGSISNFVNFTSLSVVDLSFNSFDSKFPDWLMNITSLVYVDLRYCELYGRIPISISELPNLRYLDLTGNNLSASCSQLFQGTWKNIEVLGLAGNKLHGRIPNSIGNMKSLKSFDLSDNTNIAGGLPSSIGKLCSLAEFDLSGNNLTGSLPEFLKGPKDCIGERAFPNLTYIRLSNNNLVGKLPDWLGELKNLVELSLEYNSLQGPIPSSLGNLKNLTILGFAGNELNGTLPDTIGQLAELSRLDVSYNSLTGIVSDVHFSKLTKLKFLLQSSNSLILNLSSDYVPPFQVQNLEIGSCHLGPAFPGWLRFQNEMEYLDISNTSISDSIPTWFWDISGNLNLLNASFNNLQGQLPNPMNTAPYADIDLSNNVFKGIIPIPTFGIALLDLSNNHFSGPIPENIGESMSDLIFLSLSSNNLTGEIPSSIGEVMLYLQVIDLSSNNLTRNIPSSIGNCSLLKAIDFANNNLSMEIPASFGQLKQLQSLHLSNNKLTGSFPSTFWNLSSLETLDLGKNELTGNIPLWIGDGFGDLRILSLRSNAFSGEIPSIISNLSSLQVLDFADNSLIGHIPASLGDLKAMASEESRVDYLRYGKYGGIYYEESFILNTKGQSQKYTKTLSLVNSLDLSGNKLNGTIPEELTKLLLTIY
ncbi:hypothetical protein ACFE04_002233 [Oxalis oulophora]